MSRKRALTLVLFLGLIGFTTALSWGNQRELKEAEALNKQVVKLYQAGRYREALPLAQKVLQILEKTLGPEQPQTATSLSDLAVLYQAMGAYDQALPLYRRALKIWEKALGPEHPQTALSLNNLAELYRAMGAYDQALPLHQRALKAREKALGPEHPHTASSLNNLALLYEDMGAYDQALPLHQRALKITEKALGPEHLHTATSLNNLAELYNAMGAYDQALPRYQRALKIMEKALGPEHPDTATSLHNLAGLYRAIGAYDQALPLYQRALKISEKALGPEHPSTASSLNNLAVLYLDLGVYDQALPLYQRTLKIREKALGPEHPSTASSLNNLAGLYRALGVYDQALPLYQRALQIKKKVLGPEHPDTANSLNNLALLYEDMGAYDQALPLHQRALKIWEKALGPEHPQTATSLNNLGHFYLSRKDLVQAENYFKRGNSKPSLVDLALARGRAEKALELLNGMSPGWRDTPNYQVQFYTQKGLALAGVGRLPEAAGFLWQAVEGTETLRQKVTGERVGFMQAGGYGGYVRPYRGLVTVLAQMALKQQALPPVLKEYGPDAGAAAFYFAEAAKARALLEALAQAARKTSRIELPENIRQREEALNQQLAATEAQWEKALQGGEEAVREAKKKRKKLNTELQALIGELRKSYPRYAALYYPQPLSAQDLPLRKDEVLLEYTMNEEASYVFLVRQGGVQQLFHIKLGREALEEKIQDFMEPLLNDRIGNYSLNKGKELYDLLLSPALATVKEEERLIIVPDGILGLLPFEALVIEAGQDYEKSVFMGDRHTLTYRQSATVLDLQRRLEEHQTTRPLFALGNPIYDGKDLRYQAYKEGRPAPPLLAQTMGQYGYQGLATTRRWGKTTRGDTEGKELGYPPLPETEVEVKEIARLWDIKPDPPDVLLEVWATETQLRQAPLHDYKYLHFATHADTPGKVQGIKEPFILLGQVENKGRDDGFLTLSEVLGLKLKAQMVVLSACLTGRGKVMEGEGVVNFARAFQFAGARSVVVSLWKVRSKVAVEFMKIFYGYLKEGKDRATALRLTRQKIKEDYPDPLLWAVFILHGEG